jgi:hypothetical protein
MSISSIQYKKILDGLIQYYFSTGQQPEEEDLMKDLSSYFSRYPAGSPVPIKRGIFTEGIKASDNEMNLAIATVIANLDTLYSSVDEQLKASLDTNSYLNSQLERLRLKRKSLMGKIDEFLFNTSNSDGYFYSFSDTFTNTKFTDLNLTSAFVDIKNGNISLPVNSDKVKVVPGQQVRNVNMKFYVDGVEVTEGTNKSPFAGCLDGLSNTVWSTEVATQSPSEVVCVLDFSVGSAIISRLEYDPFTISPIKSYVEVSRNGSTYSDFGSLIEEGVSNMVFTSNPIAASNVRITLKKNKADYTTDSGSGTNYVYIFGAKNIFLMEQAFVSESIWVSTPISIADDLSREHVLDSVSLKVDDSNPDNTDVQYYVALDTGVIDPTISNFDWKKITPMNDIVSDPSMIVKFSGAANKSTFIRSDIDENSDDLQLVAVDSSNADPNVRNPFSVESVDLYRIVDLANENPIISSLRLEEGVNSLKVFYVPYEDGALDLSFWTDYVNDQKKSEITYSRIDVNNNFFWGGDIGENYKSVYMETYIVSDSSQKLDLKKFLKVDANSKLWDIKVFLNGIELAYLPAGKDDALISWRFVEGLNHIAVTATIPRSGNYGYPNEGSIDLMYGENLFDYGSVRLSNWSYVDIFQLLNNDIESSKNFSIYKNADKIQLVSRVKPSNNFRILYSTPTTEKNQKIRIRADFDRSVNSSSTTPLLSSYRVRFRYS